MDNSCLITESINSVAEKPLILLEPTRQAVAVQKVDSAVNWITQLDSLIVIGDPAPIWKIVFD